MSEPAEQEEPQKLEGVTQIQDVDVLCGRGGAALRHPGNQTYRRLVNLNKGLYITCLKTEKLKISRSIVAAIREQKGRFLEKDNKNNTWYDIGDKKAVEKTSQALREGQPKLRQKIVEMGGGAMGAASLMERQYGAQASVYPEQVGLNTASNLESILPPASATQQEVAALAAAQIQRQQSLQNSQTTPQSQHAQSQGAATNGTAGMRAPADVNLSDDLQADLLQRLSLNGGGAGAAAAAAAASGDDEFPMPQQVVRELRPSLTLRGSGVGNQLGFAESQLSLMSDFSSYGGSARDNLLHHQNESLQSMDGASFRRGIDSHARAAPNHSLQSVGSGDHAMYNGRSQSSFTSGRSHEGRQQQPMPPPSSVGRDTEGGPIQYPSSIMGGSKPSHHHHHHHHLRDLNADRRQVFARMKYSRPPSVGGKLGNGSSHHGGSLRDGLSNHSVGDGMPDIHMVESQLSLISNMTDHGGSKHTPHAPSSSAAAAGAAAAAPERKPIKGEDRMLESSTHSVGMDIGSRHSIMSGLSRISDTSIDASIFSDLSKKIGNVSTRSIAMSEISGFDLAHERAAVEGEEDPFSNEPVERVSAADFDA